MYSIYIEAGYQKVKDYEIWKLLNELKSWISNFGKAANQFFKVATLRI